MLKLLFGQWIQPDPTSHRDSSSVAALEWMLGRENMRMVRALATNGRIWIELLPCH